MIYAGFQDTPDINVPLVDIKKEPSSIWRLPEKSKDLENKAEKQLQGRVYRCMCT